MSELGRGELLDAVQEERPLLGEEELVARVEQELSGVRLHLREVGIGGRVEVEVVGDAPAHAAAQLGPPAE